MRTVSNSSSSQVYSERRLAGIRATNAHTARLANEAAAAEAANAAADGSSGSSFDDSEIAAGLRWQNFGTQEGLVATCGSSNLADPGQGSPPGPSGGPMESATSQPMITYEVTDVSDATTCTLDTILVISDSNSISRCFESFPKREHRKYSSLMMAPLVHMPKLVWLEAPLKLQQLTRRYEVLINLVMEIDRDTTQLVMSHCLPTESRLISETLLAQWKPRITRRCSCRYPGKKNHTKLAIYTTGPCIPANRSCDNEEHSYTERGSSRHSVHYDKLLAAVAARWFRKPGYLTKCEKT